MYIPPVYLVVGLGDIGLFDLSVELSDLFVLSDYFVESSMQRFGQNNPISTVLRIPKYTIVFIANKLIENKGVRIRVSEGRPCHRHT